MVSLGTPYVCKGFFGMDFDVPQNPADFFYKGFCGTYCYIGTAKRRHSGCSESCAIHLVAMARTRLGVDTSRKATANEAAGDD